MKDRIKNEKIIVTYCPTEQMLADFFTKPLQGSLFEKFKRVLMGHDHISILAQTSFIPGEERVGEIQETPNLNNVPGVEKKDTDNTDETWTVVRPKKIHKAKPPERTSRIIRRNQIITPERMIRSNGHSFN